MPHCDETTTHDLPLKLINIGTSQKHSKWLYYLLSCMQFWPVKCAIYLFCKLIISHQSLAYTGLDTKSLKTSNISMRKSNRSVLVGKWSMYAWKWWADICLRIDSMIAITFPWKGWKQYLHIIEKYGNSFNFFATFIRKLHLYCERIHYYSKNNH